LEDRRSKRGSRGRDVARPAAELPHDEKPTKKKRNEWPKSFHRLNLQA
jgi:hypothetical protein